MKLALLVDENLSPKVAEFLRHQGLEASAVREVGLRGKTDHEIFDWALKNKRIVITRDLDYGRLFLSQAGPGGGTMLLRHFPRRTAPLLQAFEPLIEKGLLRVPELHNALVVVTPTGFRVRRRKNSKTV